MKRTLPLAVAIQHLLRATGVGLAFASAVQFDAASADAIQSAETSWVQVAREGTFLGHKSGPFTLDARVFEQLIQNFRAHPSFKKGADGYGSTDVIPFDWKHASEQPAAVMGPEAMAIQAAVGWARDLEVRKGADGKLQLWALARFLPEAKKLIKDGAIKSTSVAIWPNSVDPVTAVPIGYYMSSIALTNDPFIQGMAPLQASRYYADPYNPPDSAKDVLERLRHIFGLSELAALGEVMGELSKLRAIAAGGAAPPGVDVDDLVCALRCLFNLPTLSTAADVFAETDKLVARIVAETKPAAPPAQTPTTTTADREPPPANMQKDSIMNDKLLALVTLMATRLGLGAGTQINDKTDFDAVSRQLTAALDERDPCVLLEAMGDKGMKPVDAAAKYKKMLSHMGMPDKHIDLALAACHDTFKKAKMMSKDMPDLADMYSRMLEAEDASTAEDVKGTMMSRTGLDLDKPEVKADPQVQVAAVGFLAERAGYTTGAPQNPAHNLNRDQILAKLEGDEDGAFRASVKAFLASRVEVRKAYLAKYPPAQGHQAPTPTSAPGLFENFFGAGRPGAAAPGAPLALGNRGALQGPPPGAPPAWQFGGHAVGQPQNGAPLANGAPPVGNAIDLGALESAEGRTPVQKATAYAVAASPVLARMDFEAQHKAGTRLLHQARLQAAEQGITLAFDQQ